MDRRILCATMLAATMSLGGFTFAQQSSSSSDSAGGQSSSAASDASGQGASAHAGQQAMTTDPDKLFLKMAAVDNMCEMQVAQIAQTKAQSQEVKQLAQQILQDHQKAGDDLKQVAQKVGVQVPHQLPRPQQEEVAMFQSLQGADFDKQFLSQMKAAHAKDISKFGDVAKIAKNDDVKQFAQKQLPALQSHGQMVTSLASSQGLGTESFGQAQTAGSTISPSHDSPSNGASK